MLPNSNRVDIKLRYGELKPLLRWCETNCTSEWAYAQMEPPGQGLGEYEFYFEDERDLIAFTLWKT